MSPEATTAVKQLKELKRYLTEKNNLPQKHSKLMEKNEKEAPVKPLKKVIVPLAPDITGGAIRIAIIFVLSLALIIFSISTFVKIQKINDVEANPGEAYSEWYNTLKIKGDFDEMTETEWQPVQKEWKENGVTISWDDIEDINRRNEFNIYGGEASIIHDIFEDKFDSLPMVGGFCTFLSIVGIVLLIVFRKGWSDLLDTFNDILKIPKNKRQNAINNHYNQTEYKALLKQYEAKTIQYNEHTLLLKKTCEQEVAELDEKIKAIRSQLNHKVELNDIDPLVRRLESYGTIDAISDYYEEKAAEEAEEIHAAAEAMLSRVDHGFANSSADCDYTSELRRHDFEMERMERERVQMERNREWTEKREMEKAKQKRRMDDIKQREQARLKCVSCANMGKCQTAAMLNSLSCGAYRPK